MSVWGCLRMRTLISACVKPASFGNGGGALPAGRGRSRHAERGGESSDRKDTAHRRMIACAGSLARSRSVKRS